MEVEDARNPVADGIVVHSSARSPPCRSLTGLQVGELAAPPPAAQPAQHEAVEARPPARTPCAASARTPRR
jgi:hypothetical protein